MSNLKQRLKNSEHLLGTMITTFNSVDIPKILMECGYDYAIIDREHGAFTTREAANIISVGRAIDFPLLVRIPEPKREHILQTMEMGAKGILLPNVESADTAKYVVECMKYTPLGKRGVSLSRPHTDFKKVNGREYMDQSNEETIFLCQIESQKGVENCEEIINVPGVDCLFIGPNDMSSDYGILNEFENPIIIDAFNKVIAAAKAAGKHSGVHFGGAGNLKKWINSGMTVNLCNSDLGLLMAGARSEINELRESIVKL